MLFKQRCQRPQAPLTNDEKEALMKKTARLQQLIHGEQCFVLPGGGCALHGKIAEAAGFPAMYMSGMNVNASIFGTPDAGVLTMTEMAENAGRMARAIGIPLVADGDTGFGNAINVRRTVQEYIRAGVAGIQLEDQTAPKRCGFVTGKELISPEEAAGKIRAAVDAKKELDPDFVIIARTDARTAVGGGLEEVIRRLQSYKQAGADLLYMEGPLSLEEVREVRRHVEGPFTATTIELRPLPLPDLRTHQELGMCCVIVPSLIARPGYYESYRFAEDFMARGMDAYSQMLEEQKDHPLYEFRLFSFLGFPRIREMEAKYLSPENQRRYLESSGIYEPTTEDG